MWSTSYGQPTKKISSFWSGVLEVGLILGKGFHLAISRAIGWNFFNSKERSLGNGNILYIKATVVVSVRPSVCLAGRARQGQGRGGYACISKPLSSSSAGQGQGRAGGSSVFGDLEFALRVSKTQKDLGNFRIWFSGHGFQDLGSQLWGLGNFRIWFSGHGFQDVRSQFWDLDFTQCPKVMGTHGGLHSGLRPRAPTSVLRKLQLQRYRSGEHTCITICSNSMTRSKKGPKLKTGEGAPIVKCSSLGCLNIQLG